VSIRLGLGILWTYDRPASSHVPCRQSHSPDRSFLLHRYSPRFV
jgi:hypothetical protein